jgi:hypothetical protein
MATHVRIVHAHTQAADLRARTSSLASAATRRAVSSPRARAHAWRSAAWRCCSSPSAANAREKASPLALNAPAAESMVKIRARGSRNCRAVCVSGSARAFLSATDDRLSLRRAEKTA